MAAGAPRPQRVPGAGTAPPHGWPLHDAAATRTMEREAAAALPPQALMQRAGLAVARLALAVAPHARRVWVAAGRGNNGGDGLEAALHLAAAGRDVTVSLEPAERRPADAQAALARAQAAGLPVSSDMAAPDLQAGDLAIDALFGLGLSRPPEGWALAAIDRLNRSRAPVLAIDLPSGLDGDRGTVHADHACVRARWTASLLSLKPGLFTAAGRDHAGEVWFDDLGVDGGGGRLPTARLLTGVQGLWPRRRHAQHKGSFGDVWVIGGAPGMAGAPVLAARAASAAGAGRVLQVSLDPQAPALDASHPELMHRPPGALQAAGKALAAATVVCGCGGGEAVRALLPLLLSNAARLLLDADALNALAGDAALAPLLAARAGRLRPTVLTPHPLEAARLLACTAADVQADRLAAAQAIAERHRATVVLKGSGSVIAAPGQAPWINASGNAALASAGTGDVLAGWIGGLWAQGLAPGDAARLGTWTHGAAADRWQAGRREAAALQASELIGALRALRAG